MKKYLPYSLAFLLMAAIVILFLTGNKDDNRRMDERITLRKRDKIPYGTYVAYNNLKYLFPDAAIYTNKKEPGYWDSLNTYDSDQAFVAITDRFSPYDDQIQRMITFARKGNDVFVSTRYIAASVDRILGCSSSSFDLSIVTAADMPQEMQISLKQPPFSDNVSYKYPGKTFLTYFTSVDTVTTTILGVDEKKRPNFIHLKAGKGNIFIHLEPLAFCNFFLLHKQNISYYNKALSVINPAVKKIIWDEYFLSQRGDNEKDKEKKGWLSVLSRFPGLKAALLTALFLLLLYVLMEMRRKQRIIPVVNKPKNDSLDFVKTIGRLYYDKGDHKNLCRKMAAYFLEHIRTRYKLPTGILDDEFIKLLQFKSGAGEDEIRRIVSFIKNIDEAKIINDKQLYEFHKQLDSFYQKA
ncbi:MAG: hypothetical protein WBC06_04130 [Chitinophagaceae bacterium]